MKIKHLILLLLIPLSEIKSIFYESDLKVDWYLFVDHERYLCNVLEDYSNVIIYGVFAFYTLFVKLDIICKQILLFLLVTCIFDFIFTLLFDNQFFWIKIVFVILTYVYANSKIIFQRN